MKLSATILEPIIISTSRNDGSITITTISSDAYRSWKFFKDTPVVLETKQSIAV